MCWYVKDSHVRLFEFMTKVAKDKNLQSEYAKDPKAVMQKEGLSKEHQQLLLSKNHEEFLTAVAGRH